MSTTILTLPPVDWDAVKARAKATWESGDFGQIARSNEPPAEEFMARVGLKPGARLLDVACGTGNLAIIAARRGCRCSGIDIARNLVAQARKRAAQESLEIEFTEGDAEALPYPDGTFDFVVSMFGVMFAPRPRLAASELLRVTKRGGTIALANWTPQGFIGRMFEVFRKHIPPPAGLVSPLEWGTETLMQRLFGPVSQLRCQRRIARLRYPYDPAGTVEFFRRYYGPTQKAFASLAAEGQTALRRDLEDFQAAWNRSSIAGETEVHAEYLELLAIR